ncbi:hypothetical protein HW509_07060 [Asaia spathodeae]|uniref:hypothetical protein n=1 Tax=Asaia spathodeae TaxID=657016 RepID=UPI002FC2E8BB
MNEKNIIIMQAISAALMGSDYFMPESLRKSINDPLRDYFLGVKERALKPFPDYWNFFWKNKRETVYPLAIVLLSLFISELHPFSIHYTSSLLHVVISIIIIFWFLIFAISIILISNSILNQIATLVLLNIPITGLAFFLEKSGKGPMAASGFIILMISFYIRYKQ